MSRVLIGTSGWHYKHWLDDVFYPTGTRPTEMFKFYARLFDNWRDSSPSRFVFAVKASRFITHMKKLKDPKSSSEKFFDVADRLGRKLGPILFQLPPRWKLNLDRLEEFLESLPDKHKYVFEFRDESWFVPEVYKLLHRYKAAYCIHDFADLKVPLEITASFTYIRFHGPTSAKYFGSYSSTQLGEWAERIGDWNRRLKAVYVYFNNDPGGEAVKNALELKRLVGIL